MTLCQDVTEVWEHIYLLFSVKFHLLIHYSSTATLDGCRVLCTVRVYLQLKLLLFSRGDDFDRYCHINLFLHFSFMGTHDTCVFNFLTDYVSDG